MRVTTWNVNGIRAAIRKGMLDEVDRIGPDVLLLQEVRARPEQLDEAVATPTGWHVYWHPADKLGYSGTAIWSREPMKIETVGLGGNGSDPEGRLIVARVGGVRVVSVYLPSGSSGQARQAVKDGWLEALAPWAARFARSRIPTVIGGDFNIAHTARDIFYAKANEKSSGFLPHERAWMGEFLEGGWSDFVREASGAVDGPYSWWSNRGRARELDRGWRIDYVVGNRAADRRVDGAWVDRAAGLTVSDHAPVSVDLAV
jgi:exodeoxyribonuclease III